jgi:hypothetical protein
VDQLTKRVLGSFAHWQQDSLDLHTLFEAGGNDPDARTRVFDMVEQLVKDGLLEEQGNDFYALTEKGKTTAQGFESEWPDEAASD